MTKIEMQTAICPDCGHQFKIIAKTKEPVVVLECLNCFMKEEPNVKKNSKPKRI